MHAIKCDITFATKNFSRKRLRISPFEYNFAAKTPSANFPGETAVGITIKSF